MVEPRGEQRRHNRDRSCPPRTSNLAFGEPTVTTVRNVGQNVGRSRMPSARFLFVIALARRQNWMVAHCLASMGQRFAASTRAHRYPA